MILDHGTDSWFFILIVSWTPKKNYVFISQAMTHYVIINLLGILLPYSKDLRGNL